MNEGRLISKHIAMSFDQDLWLYFVTSIAQSTHYHQPQLLCGNPCRDEVMHVNRWKLSGDKVMLYSISKLIPVCQWKLLTVSKPCETSELQNTAPWLSTHFITVNVTKYKRIMTKRKTANVKLHIRYRK